MLHKNGIVSMYMSFEYDDAKSEANRQKHGIDFESAKQLWQVADLIEIPARTEDERRFVVIGKLNDKPWSGRKSHTVVPRLD